MAASIIVHVCMYQCEGVYAYNCICFYTPLRTWNSAPTPTVHAPLPRSPPAKDQPPKIANCRPPRRGAGSLWQLLRGLSGLSRSPPQQRLRDKVHCLGWCSFRACARQFAGDAQHEVTRLQRPFCRMGPAVQVNHGHVPTNLHVTYLRSDLYRCKRKA